MVDLLATIDSYNNPILNLLILCKKPTGKGRPRICATENVSWRDRWSTSSDKTDITHWQLNNDSRRSVVLIIAVRSCHRWSDHAIVSDDFHWNICVGIRCYRIRKYINPCNGRSEYSCVSIKMITDICYHTTKYQSMVRSWSGFRAVHVRIKRCCSTHDPFRNERSCSKKEIICCILHSMNMCHWSEFFNLMHKYCSSVNLYF